MELSADEAAENSSSINIILKSGAILNSPADIESTFQAVFDIAEGIAAVDCCAFVAFDCESGSYDIPFTRNVAVPSKKRPAMVEPATLARHFGKPVLLDSSADGQLLEFCEPWASSTVMAFPVRRGTEFVGSIVFGKKTVTGFSRPQIKLLWTLAMQTEGLLLQNEALKSLSFYSFFDPLTHLHNRRHFDAQLDIEIHRAWRGGKPFSLLRLDIDTLQSRDSNSARRCDEAHIQELATILRESVRETDTVSRFEGDGFAILLADSNGVGARNLSSRISKSFHGRLLHELDGTASPRPSLSIGIASFLEDASDRQGLLAKATKALEHAQSLGGGRICLHCEIDLLSGADHLADEIPAQKIFDAARSVVDMDKFLEVLLYTSMRGLSAGRGSIVVPDASGEFTLRATVGFGPDDKFFSRGSKVVPGPATSWVVDNREALVVGNNGTPLDPKIRSTNGYKGDSFISVPLMHQHRLLGIVHLTNRVDGNHFSTDDLRSFKPIADGIASILSQGLAFRENVRSFSMTMLRSLSDALELRFPFLTGHSARVCDMSVRIGKRLGLGSDEIAALRAAAELHDIGIVCVPGSLLSTSKQLNDNELEIARRHPIIGSQLINDGVDLAHSRRFILEHHERFNGTGYPNGLKGDSISLGGRILAVAEYFDSITSVRPHRGSMSPSDAAQFVRNGANTLFDPAVVKEFLSLDLFTTSSAAPH